MRVIQILVVGLCAAALCAARVHAADPPPPPEAYGRLPAIGSAVISPDGKRLALSVGYEFHAAEPERELTAFRVLNIDTGQFEHTFAPPPGNILRGTGWADERRPYYFISSTGRTGDALPSSYPALFRGDRVEFWRTGVLSLDTSKSTLLMQDPEHKANFSLTNLWVPIEGDPGFGRMIAWGGLATFNDLPGLAVWRVSLDTGRASPVADGNAKTRGFMLDERGAVVARVDINERNDRWKLFTYEKGKPKLVLEDVSEGGRPLMMFGLLADGRIAAINQHEDGERDTLLAIDRQTGQASPLLNAHGSDIGVIGDINRRVVGVTWTEDLPKQQFLEPTIQAIYDALQPKFADGYVQITSWSRDGSRYLVYGEHADDAGAWYVYEPGTQRLRLVGKLYPALRAAAHLGERSAIRFPARDGTSVPAYLTVPVGVEKRKLPLVLLVHGGPHARDDFTFDWWPSFLASRGYAVLQVNFRGSTGYGYEWFHKGRGGWGDGVMQTDVEDGADALVKNGMVDPARICIMGGSYGGYAALAGATVTPDRYACAVSVNGVSDPERMLDESKRGIHGNEDTVVPVEQSRRMNETLRDEKKPVRYVELKGDDHWLSSASMRTQMLSEIEKFLAENIGAKSPASAGATGGR